MRNGDGTERFSIKRSNEQSKCGEHDGENETEKNTDSTYLPRTMVIECQSNRLQLPTLCFSKSKVFLIFDGFHLVKAMIIGF